MQLPLVRPQYVFQTFWTRLGHDQPQPQPSHLCPDELEPCCRERPQRDLCHQRLADRDGNGLRVVHERGGLCGEVEAVGGVHGGMSGGCQGDRGGSRGGNGQRGGGG